MAYNGAMDKGKKGTNIFGNMKLKSQRLRAIQHCHEYSPQTNAT